MTAQIIQFPRAFRPVTVSPEATIAVNGRVIKVRVADAEGVTVPPVAAPAPVVKPVAFEVGKSYSCRSACDSDCIFTVTVVKRTAKRITFTYHGKTETRGVSLYDNAETCKIFGDYSMCPIIRADRECW